MNNTLEILRMAIQSLIGNKMRSWLSVLGIIIGVSTVIAVVGIGLGAQKKVNDQFKNLSVTTLIVMGSGGRSASSKINDTDIDYVLNRADTIASGTAVMRGNSQTVNAGNTEGSYSLLGINPEFFEESNLFFETGKTIERSDNTSRARKIILGSIVAEELFEGIATENIVGQFVTVDRKKFEIIGILKSNGQSGMISYDETIYIPFKTAEKNILGERGSVMLFFNATSIDTVNIAQLELESLLREAHRLRDTQDSDFRVRDPGSMVSSAQESSETLTYLLVAVATIVLIVSGIGIMNVMFVSVSERTKEIGILKAIGAQQNDILFQFLIEAVLLSLIGGLLGIGIGNAVIPFLKESFDAVHSLGGIIIGFSFSALVGIFFGFYPAWKASKLDPVDALRSE